MKLKWLVVFLAIPLLFLASCRKDVISDNPAFKLGFSEDTLLFDTVFTTIGSSTQNFLIYNNNSSALNISSISLAGGSASQFRMNVNGAPGLMFQDLELASGDSMFIFVEVTVDPTNANIPLLINDSIVFITNTNEQSINLLAYGQDAHFHLPTDTIFFSNGYIPFSYAGCDKAWASDKPHVLYGLVVVDEDSTLVIEKNSRIHMHPNAILWVYDGGSLEMDGALGEEIIVQGDRPEPYYEDIPGQWGRIWLSAGSINNKIDYAVIKNGDIGILCDTLGASANPTLKISNTVIQNMSSAGIYAQGSWVEGYNVLIKDCGQYALALSLGGKYKFEHSTIGNYWSFNTRSTPSLALNNFYFDASNNLQLRDLTQAYFGNCIIYGNNAEEILLSDTSLAQFNFQFDHCLLRTEEDVSDVNKFINCVINPSGDVFHDPVIMDYRIAENSAAIDNGASSIGLLYPFDLIGESRTDDIAPDLGAYEYQLIPD